MLDLVHERLNDVDTTTAREEAYFAGARINDDQLRDAAGVLPVARPWLPAGHRLRRRLDRSPATGRRQRPTRTRAHRRDHRTEIERALDDPDPLRGIAQLTARWAAALVLDPAGVNRTKALGTERRARTLRDALPGGR